MNRIITLLFIISSVFPLHAQNLSDAGAPQHRYPWNGAPGTESYQSAVTSAEEPNHFVPVWTGNGLDQMNINVVLATLDGVNLEMGDEIAVFDGNLCVGTGKLSVTIDFQHMLNIKASRNDGSGNGYTPGHPIVYRFWDQSAGKEIEIVSAFYYSTNPAWSYSGNYEPDATAFVELTGRTFVAQSIDFTSGWNIFSVYLTPDSLNMKTIFKPLISDASLVKVQDEKGNSLEDYGMFGGWTNNIGNIALTEGYKVKVNMNCQLQFEGVPATLPLDIPLTAGWNIMGYPRQTETNGMTLMQPLINRNTLVKVQDEKGNSIEDYGFFGGWTNNIGNFRPGEGYKVKVTTNETLTIAVTNQLPGLPFNPSPADSAMGITTMPALSWECVDPEDDALTYDVYMGTSPGSLVHVSVRQSATSYTPSSGLIFGTTYYWVITARDDKGNATEGPVWRFTVMNETGTFTDSRDNKTYKWVKIGNQVWMAENLAWLPAVSPPSAESSTLPYYYVYGYNGSDVNAAKTTTNYSVYGVLYNWPAVMNGGASSNLNPSGVPGACPAGWHIPSDTEWTVLSDYLIINGYGYQGSGNDIAKSLAATTNWNSSAFAGTPGNNPLSNNSSGLSGLPGGYRRYDGAFVSIGISCSWWTSTAQSSTGAWHYSIFNSREDATLVRYTAGKVDGLFVRCVRDSISIPSVTTLLPDSLTNNSAILGGEVTSNGGSAVTERGICYGTTQTPTTESIKVVMGSGIGTFKGKVTGLTSNTTYYARAYAITNLGTTYGNEVSFETDTFLGGLIAYYPFNGNANDESGNGNHGTVQGATLNSDRFGNANRAYFFDGTDDFIEIGDKFNDLNLPFSISTWIYKTTISADECIFHSDDFTNNYYYGFWFSAYNSNIGITYGDGGYAASTSRRGKYSTSSFLLNGWNHITAVATSGSDIIIYINGLDGGGSYDGSGGKMMRSNNPAIIGKRSFQGNRCFNGVIDDIRVYNRALSKNEIHSLYHENGWELNTLALVNTSSATNITSSEAEIGGNVISDGGSAVTERGICYGTTQAPSIEDSKMLMGSGLGEFSGKITGLVAKTTFYARAYAINSQGTSYGNEVSFTTDTIFKGLVAYYPFNGNANDESRNENHGTVFGALLSTDRFGVINSSYSFNGAGDYIMADASKFPTAERTISLWFYANTIVTRPGVLGYGGGDGSALTSLLMGLNLNGRESFHMSCHSLANPIDYYYSAPPINAWYHWVITTDISGTKLYVNGILKASNTIFINDTYVNGSQLGIGTIVSWSGIAPYTDGNVGYFDGLIDDIRIYNKVLNPEEISGLYHENGWPLDD